MNAACQKPISYNHQQSQNAFLNDLCTNVLEDNREVIISFFKSFFTRSSRLNVLKEVNGRLSDIFEVINQTNNISKDEFDVINGLIFKYLTNQLTQIRWHEKLISFIEQYTSRVVPYNVKKSAMNEGTVVVIPSAAVETHEMITFHKNRADEAERNERQAKEELKKAKTLLENQEKHIDEMHAEYKIKDEELQKIKAARARSQQLNQGRESGHTFWNTSANDASKNQASDSNLEQQVKMLQEQLKAQEKNIAILLQRLEASNALPKDENSASSSTQPSAEAVVMK